MQTSRQILLGIKSWRVRREGHAARMVEKRNAHRNLAGNSKRKTALGRSRHRWENKSVPRSFKLCHDPYILRHITFITRQQHYSPTLQGTAQDSPDIKGSILNVECQVIFAPHPVFYNLHLNNAVMFTTFPYIKNQVEQQDRVLLTIPKTFQKMCCQRL